MAAIIDSSKTKRSGIENLTFLKKNPKKTYDHLMKIILVGDSGVGKSCLRMRYSDNKFTYNFVATIGIDFHSRYFESDGALFKMQLWDTAGQERFRSVTKNYYRGADGFVFVYDVSRRESFENVVMWLESTKGLTKRNIRMILLGNKVDLPREVSTNEGHGLAARYGMAFIETSAKANLNVNAAFSKIAIDVKDMILEKRGMVKGACGDFKDKLDTKKSNNLKQCCIIC